MVKLLARDMVSIDGEVLRDWDRVALESIDKVEVIESKSLHERDTIRDREAFDMESVMVKDLDELICIVRVRFVLESDDVRDGVRLEWVHVALGAVDSDNEMDITID